MNTVVWKLKLRKIGNSVGVVLPKEVLARLNADAGDTLYLTESVDGSFQVTATNCGFAERMMVAEGLSHRYRKALRKLAK